MVELVEHIKTAGQVASAIMGLFALGAFFVKPFRSKFANWVKLNCGIEEIKEQLEDNNKRLDRMEKGLIATEKEQEAIADQIDVLIEGGQCSLRDIITNAYYEFVVEKKSIPEWQREKVARAYLAYKKENGNSYVDLIYPEIMELPGG